jgi:hypothetical protein
LEPSISVRKLIQHPGQSLIHRSTRHKHTQWPLPQRSQSFTTSTSAPKAEEKSTGKTSLEISTFISSDLTDLTYSVFLHELSIDFEDKRYPYDTTWPELSKSYQEKGLSVTGKMPILEMDGHILTQVRLFFLILSETY